MATPLLLLLLAVGVPTLDGAFMGPRLARCPRDDLTLSVPEDLPVGAVLFTWDPARLTVRSSHEAYKRKVTKTLNHVSPGARAFFTGGGPEDAFSLATGHPQATLTRALRAGGPDLVRGRYLLTCGPANSTGGSQHFRLHLNLTRLPLRLWVEPPRPMLARGSPAGAHLATVGVFAAGRRVTPDACAAAAADGRRRLTVGPGGQVAMATPAAAALDSNDVEWTATVTCELGGRRARVTFTVAPLRLWRRRHSRVRAAEGSGALAGARLVISLDALLTRPGPRVRLAGSSDPGRVWLAPGTLLLDLAPPGGRSLSVTLEATDAEGRSESATLLLEPSDRLLPQTESADPPPCAAAAPWWWPAPIVAGAVALCLACAWPAVHQRILGAARRRRQCRRLRLSAADSDGGSSCGGGGGGGGGGFPKPQFV